MDHHQTRHLMTAHDLLAWRSSASTKIASIDGEDLAGEMDEPPDHGHLHQDVAQDFHKSIIRPLNNHTESLLTRALHPIPGAENVKPEIHVSTEMSRRRSLISNTSTASTADLTSDGGITSPARTDTPSPPFPPSTYINIAPYNLDVKTERAPAAVVVKAEALEPVVPKTSTPTELPKPDPAVEALVKKRCITFACGAQKPKPVSTTLASAKSDTELRKEPAKRCTIKFACMGPKAEKTSPAKPASPEQEIKSSLAVPAESQRHHSRSPSINRKIRPIPSPHAKLHRDSTSTVRRASQSPTAVRSRKPTYIIADEATLQSSEATRFHEFASDEVQEDDWIRTDASLNKAKLTISDTLRKENAIRQLGKEAEEEALEDEEALEEDDEDVAEDSEDEREDDVELEDMDDDDDNTVEASDQEDVSDGNETDNEAGFADSDDESDAGGDFQFWTPGRSIPNAASNEASAIRLSAHRTASNSSIDSLGHMSPIPQAFSSMPERRSRASRKIRIRPGTPDLPDSTDFVCGTLDEDRPLEDAYVSCMEARKREKHHLIPQDIDPSFPTSEPEDEDEDEIAERAHDSEEQIWLHGKFEDSDDSRARRRRPSLRKSPNQSPRRMHSPPPPKRYHSPPPTKTRHRSPPPSRRLFSAQSPRRAHSPPPARTIRSPPASPTANAATTGAIAFAPLASRPGLTHTKSLPRRPNAFGQQYRAARLAALQATDGSDNIDGHTRGAIDIFKGLEQKRQRRKEKFYQKYCNRARKQPDRKPQPGKGAERMKEVGLYMAGKIENRNGKAEFVLSV